MPRSLLREPHLLAHELRTPLTILAGWYSLIQSGEITPQTTPGAWEDAMTACQRAVERLNVIINEACDEAEGLARLRPRPVTEEFTRMVESTAKAVIRSREVLAQIEKDRRRRVVGGRGRASGRAG